VKHEVTPLRRRDGEPVLVDGHPICEACGAPAGLTRGERWRHVSADAPWPPRVVSPADCLAAVPEPSTVDNPLLELVTRLLGDPPRQPAPGAARPFDLPARRRDRKSTRLNSSHP